MPELDLDLYGVSNISSTIPESQWKNQINEDQELFWITRFLGDSEPSQWVINNGNVKQPCILFLR